MQVLVNGSLYKLDTAGGASAAAAPKPAAQAPSSASAAPAAATAAPAAAVTPVEVKDVVVPNITESIHTGVLGKWNKKVGDFVYSGEAVTVIETDKVITTC